MERNYLRELENIKKDILLDIKKKLDEKNGKIDFSKSDSFLNIAIKDDYEEWESRYLRKLILNEDGTIDAICEEGTLKDIRYLTTDTLFDILSFIREVNA